ncbi:hypothetical protein D3273_26535, partial [Lichenibacterium minor]
MRDVGEIIAGGVVHLAKTVGVPIRVLSIPGNHGRDTHKPWAKRRAASSWDLLAVWSRNEVMRVDFEHSWVGSPGTADRLKRCFPLQRFEVLGKVVSRDEGQDVCAQYLCGVVVKRLVGRFL